MGWSCDRRWIRRWRDREGECHHALIRRLGTILGPALIDIFGQLPLNLVLLKHVSIIGIFWGSYRGATRALSLALFLIAWLKSLQLRTLNV